MRLLDGAQLAEYIKTRQAKQATGLSSSIGRSPSLAILQTKDDPVINAYVRLKKIYGQDIGVEVAHKIVVQNELPRAIETYNHDPEIDGVIVQLPLTDVSQTSVITNLLAPHKDIDGLGAHADYDSATVTAINWLLAGYNIDLKGKNIVIIGSGRLVGKPLYDTWKTAGYNASVVNKSEKNLTSALSQADIIVSATGVGGLLKSEMIPINCVVVDAGVADEGGQTKGDVNPDVYQSRHDLTITPPRGGVGPLTVAALFDNLLRACQ